MKEIYYIYAYIPSNIFDNTIKFFLSHPQEFRFKKESMFGLYAWTAKKKFVKEFFEIRSKKPYIMINETVDESQIVEMKMRYSSLELKRYKYKHIDENGEEREVGILSTKDEYVCSVMDAEENIYEFGPSAYRDIPATMFKSKIFDALDILGYVSSYALKYGNEEERDWANYNEGFNLTPDGRHVRLKVEDNVNVLLYLFHYLFYGY